ncbi:MAG: serine/threonine protein kinase [Deltaproteobacteria bacterium]|nr:serine/threonine protein kinase [Deltaproteobacteria bacterium]
MAGERLELCGKTLDGKYRILRRIGLGGSGIVFEATCISDDAIVAIKMLRPEFIRNFDLDNRLRREAEVSRRVRHPGIIPVIDQGTLLDGSSYIVMRRMYGESMSRLLLRVGELRPDHVIAITLRLATILHSVHCAGYIHRDIKPEHILLNRSANGDLLVYLLDFGVCASSYLSEKEKEREFGKVFGTPTYVSPEQASGNPDVDGRSDLFSLGVVLFEALTGRLPFAGVSIPKLLLSIVRKDAPRLRFVNPKIEPALDDIVASLLAREPEARLPSARVLSRALKPMALTRRQSEREVAAQLHVTSHISDFAPTVRCRIPIARMKAA